MKPAMLVLSVFLCSTVATASASELVVYEGPHPIDPAIGAGMCYIEGPHVHSYRPHKEVLYVHDHDAWVFVGDPTEFGHDGPRHVYYGHHPIFWEVNEPDAHEHYCFISGPHHHLIAPPERLSFKRKGGAYWYVGSHPVWYKKRVHKRLDTYYRTAEVVHPVVEEAPPPGFIGLVVGAPSVQVGVSLPILPIGLTVERGHVPPPRHRVVEHHVVEHHVIEHHHHKHKHKHFHKKGKDRWKR